MPDEGRRVVLEGAANFRDVGGLPLVGGGHVRRGRLFRSDSLHRLTEGDVKVLHDDLGVHTVVDLRTDDELAEHGHAGDVSPHVRVEHLPLFEVILPEWLKPEAWSSEQACAERYAEFATSGVEHLVRFVRILGDDAGPTVVHCQQGRDRTGVAVAVVLDLLGVERDAIADDYGVTGRYITDFEITPLRMALTLQLLDASHGSPEAMLRARGLTDDDLARLRAALT